MRLSSVRSRIVVVFVTAFCALIAVFQQSGSLAEAKQIVPSFFERPTAATSADPISTASVERAVRGRSAYVDTDGHAIPSATPPQQVVEPGISAPQATFTVTKTADTNDGACNADCSLREAISAANASPGADTIIVPAGTYTLTLTNAGGTNEDSNATGDLDVLDSVTIQGAGAASTIIQAGTTNANGIDKVLALNPICTSAVNVAIDGVTIRFGRNTQPSGAADFSFTGGGVDWCGFGTGNFTLSHSVISTNTNVNGYGGGLNLDAASGYTGTVSITGVTFDHNQTNGATGGGATGGAINIFETHTVNITNSTFTSNQTLPSTSGGGAIYYRPTQAGSLSISGSTFSFNTAGGIGGAIATATFAAGTTVTVTSSLFNANTATNSFGGALDLDSTTATTTPFSLSQLTITGNHAGISGGGVYVGNSNVTLSKSVIVGNTATTGSGIHKSVDASTATVTNNWWGCSTGPGAAPCDRATTSGGTITFTPWYRNQLTATTSPLVVNQSTSLTSSFLTNSAGSSVPLADLAEIIGRSVTWGATNGNLSGTQGTVQAAGTATGSFQAAAIGTAVISAKVDNDNTAPVSSNVLSVTVNKANTTAAITNSASLSSTPSVTGQPVTVTYSVTGAFGNSPTAPTGNVTVSDGTDSCTATVAAGQCNLTFRTVGAKTFTATYAGDTNFNTSPASASASHTVNKANTTTTISSDSPDPSVTGQAVTFNVTVAAVAPGAAVAPTTITGTVAVSDGGTNTCNATLTAGSGSCNITFTSAGPYSMTGTYGSDSNFNGSSSVTNSHTVNKASTTTALGTSGSPSVFGQSVTFTATVSVTLPGAGTPTGNISFFDNAVSIGACSAQTVSSGQATCSISTLAVGSHPITAVYNGDSSFSASPASNTVTQVVNPSCTANPVVVNSNDSGAGSLRQAVLDSCAGSTITFDPSVTAPVTLSSGHIAITKNLTIAGSGVSTTIIQAAATPGTAANRVFLVNGGVTATISNLTVANGVTSTDNGGGIRNDGTLALSNCAVSNNRVTSGGTGGGIYNAGNLTISNCTISGNSTLLTSGQGGGVFHAGTSFSMTGSTFVGNSSVDGGGLYISIGPSTVTNTTFNNNTSSGRGSAVVTIGINSPFTNCTISGNHSGALNFGAFTAAINSATIVNTIIAGNDGGGSPTDISVASGGTIDLVNSHHNLIGTGGSGGLIDGVNGNQVGVANALLGPLAANGGPTQTMALLPGSPALDKGVNSLALTTDQRGGSFARTIDNPGIAPAAGGDNTDIGAFERSSFSASVSVSGRVLTSDGRPISKAVVVISGPGGTQVALSSPFGYYRFDGLTQGGAYTVSASSKLYTVPSIGVTPYDDLPGTDLIASP